MGAVDLKWAAGIGAVLAIGVLALGFQWQLNRARLLEARIEAREAELAAAQGVIGGLRRDLANERAAVTERAARLMRTDRDREAFRDALEVCELDSEWSVPDALYERLCGAGPGGDGVPGGPPGGVFRGRGETGSAAQGDEGVSDLR